MAFIGKEPQEQYSSIAKQDIEFISYIGLNLFIKLIFFGLPTANPARNPAKP